MGKEKIVLDTNNLISALGWRGNPRHIFEKVVDGTFELILSAKQINELLRVLEYQKFKFTNEQKSRFISILFEISTLIETEHSLDIIKEDPSDNMLLESATEGKANYIITGDAHLLKLKEFEGIKILPPKEFLDLLK